MLTNSVILTISGCDTLRPIGTSSLGPSQIVYMTLNSINGAVRVVIIFPMTLN